MCPCRGGHIDAAPVWGKTKASDDTNFGAHSRSFNTCSPTLRVSCCHSRARLASGWLAGLYREGVEPSGSLRKVSDHTVILLSCSPDATQIALDQLTRFAEQASYPSRRPTGGPPRRTDSGRIRIVLAFSPAVFTSLYVMRIISRVAVRLVVYIITLNQQRRIAIVTLNTGRPLLWITVYQSVTIVHLRDRHGIEVVIVYNCR